jgi:hypothetical protein
MAEGLLWCLNQTGCAEKYGEIYDEFNRFEWRMRSNGKWYREDQTEVPLFSAA